MDPPSPTLVSPSTTLVQVDTLQSPYTPVILNQVQYTGQVVSVLNTLSSLQILTNPIVVSTTAQNLFANSTFSTLIQQPQGFLTVQSQTPSQWSFLNSYPFRDQYVSAGVQILTTSSLYSHLVSTVQDNASSLTVENLIVSGNFFQSSGLVLNTTVSSLGAVTLLSSLTVLGNTYFSSAVSSFGGSIFGSTLSVGKDFVSRSSLQLLSTFSISTSLSIGGFLSSPLIQLEGGLAGGILQVQSSSQDSVLLSGSLDAQGAFRFLSSVAVGGAGTFSGVAVAGFLSSLSSMNVDDRIRVSNNSILGGLSVEGQLHLGGSLDIHESLEVVSTVRAESNASVLGDVYGLSTLSTQTLEVSKGVVFGNMHVVSSSVVSTQSIVINGNLGFGNVVSVSTSVGGNVSTTTDFVAGGSTRFDSYMDVRGSLSSLTTMTIGQDMLVVSNVNVGRTIGLTQELTVGKSLDVLGTSYWSTLLPFSSFVQGNLEVLGSLRVSETALLPSIQLPLDVIAFNFEVSSMNAGFQGIVSTVEISTLMTSTLAAGGLLAPATTMDMLTPLNSLSLSTSFLSTSLLETYSSSMPSTIFHLTSSLGITIPAAIQTVEVGTLAYTQGPTYVGKIISALTITATPMNGFFVGDGTDLRDVNYPENLTIQYLSTGKLIVEKGFISALTTSSGIINDVFDMNSTLRIGDFYIYGAATEVPSVQSNVLVAPSSDPTVLALNNLYCYGDTVGIVPKQVIVNREILPSLSSNYAFGVGGTFRVSQLSSPNYILELDTFRGDVVVARDIGAFNKNTIYVSSGVIGWGGRALFIPEGPSPLVISTNVVQPFESTLSFNSTLFVNYETHKVGINTKPTYTFDISPNALVYDQIIALTSSVVADKVFVQQSTNQIWLATTGASSAQDIQVSYDQGQSWAPFAASNPNEGQGASAVAYDGGYLALTSSNTLRSYKQWVVGGNGYIMVHYEGSGIWINSFKADSGPFPIEVRSAAHNGLVWVAAGRNPGPAPPQLFPTLVWSSNGLAWYNATQGGFNWDFTSDYYGGESVAWNGSQWLACGRGSNAKNSILNSFDGKTWCNSYTQSFLKGANGAVWTGSHWVATGNNGGPLSSFMISTDGSNWTGIGGYGFDSQAGEENQRGYGIATDGYRIVAVGSYSPFGTAASIQYSDNGGYTWSNSTGGFSSDARTVVWNGRLWMVGGVDGVRVSSDGKSWQTTASPPSFAIDSLAYGSNALPIFQFGESNYVSTIASTLTTMNVACGRDTTGDLNCLRYSENGSNWNYALSGYFTDQGRGAAYNGSNLWVAAGKGTASNFIYSGDGRSWSNAYILSAISLTATGTCVVYGGNTWLAGMDTLGGGGDTLFYSFDGTTWFAIGSIFLDSCQGIAYNPSATQWVAVGRGGGTIQYTTFGNPTLWFPALNSFDLSGNGVAYGGSLWVAVGADSGGNTIKYSADGQSWSDGTNMFGGEGFGVGYNGSNLWVAVGRGGGSTSNILTSLDGMTWANSTSGEFQTAGYGVGYNQGLGLWIATGYDSPGVGTIKYSTNGLNWLDGTSGFDDIGFGIGVASNVTIFEDLKINQLRIYDTPGPGVLLRSTTPNIAFTSTQMTLMNTLTIDSRKNITLQLISTQTVSTFVDSSLARVSKVVSTQTVQAAGFYLSLASV